MPNPGQGDEGEHDNTIEFVIMTVIAVEVCKALRMWAGMPTAVKAMKMKQRLKLGKAAVKSNRRVAALEWASWESFTACESMLITFRRM